MDIKTLNYYNNNAKSFHENTFNVNMDTIYEKFLKYVNGNSILDLGCGSGRDVKYFEEKGYEVIGIDFSQKLIEIGRNNVKSKLIVKDFLSLNYKEEFNGIWACASLLHLNIKDMKIVLDNIYNALKDDGVIYISLKYGDFEGYIDDRFFKYVDEKSLDEIINTKKFEILEEFFTEDFRVNKDFKWINLILKKKKFDKI